MMQRHTQVTIAVALGAASCARGPDAGGSPTAEQDSVWLAPPPEDVHGPDTPWDEMSHEQQAQYMSEHVVPTMAPLFRHFDESRFAEVNCATCHGPNGRDNGFHMPNPGLPELPRPGSPQWEEMAQEQYQMFRFMSERVQPTMAALLGKPNYDPLTREGFACFECHTRAD